MAKAKAKASTKTKKKATSKAKPTKAKASKAKPKATKTKATIAKPTKAKATKAKATIAKATKAKPKASTKPKTNGNSGKGPPRVAFKGSVGSDGGPLLALPSEALGAWQGVLDPRTGVPPQSGDFGGTDYGRACAVSEDGPRQSPWGGFGFLDVGEHKGLVVGRNCSMARLEDGTALLVMEGESTEVAAFLEGDPKWEEVPGRLTLPGGALVVFDSALEEGKTNNKATLQLTPGSYRVDEHHSENGQSLWIVKLSAAG